MGMKINAELPLPAELKAEYPLSEEIIRIKEKRTGRYGISLRGDQISLS